VSIEDWRRKIDEIDTQLLSLLNERARCALEIGREKEAANLPVYQPDRENEILEHVERANGGPLGDSAVRRLFERIIDEARSIERAVRHHDGAPGGAAAGGEAKKKS